MPQVKFDFNKMTTAGLKSFIKKFEKKGLPIADVDAPNRPRRESGVLVKTATFIFETGQKLIVRVKADGTVFQVKLNARVIPIKNVDNVNKAVDEIIAAVKENEPRYLKAQRRRLAKIKLKIDKPVTVKTTRRQKLEQAESRTAELEAETNQLQQQLDTHTKTISTKTSQLSELGAKLQTLRDKGKELQSELQTLKEAA